jgi:hypothetical protein
VTIRLTLLKGEGRVRVGSLDLLASRNPHLNPLPFSKGEAKNDPMNAKRMRKRRSPKSTSSADRLNLRRGCRGNWTVANVAPGKTQN